uniref:Uncharacterized protein n=1 Tax=Steinernema glaseri TaxID=37863 RepID=A0A1I7Y8K8_9BILA
MSALRSASFGQNSSALLQRGSQHFALVQERQREDEIRRKTALKREEERLAFEKERLELLEERKQKLGFPRKADPNEIRLKEMRRDQIRKKLQSLKSSAMKTSERSVGDDCLGRVQQLTEADLYEDDLKHERAIQKAKHETRRRILMQIRSAMPKGSRYSDEELMRAYEAGMLQRRNRAAPSSTSTQPRLERNPAKKDDESVPQETVATTSNFDGGVPEKYVVIDLGGIQYELVGVPREEDGRVVQLELNKFEPNFVSYFYEGDKYRSAVLLPPSTKTPKPAVSSHPKPLRLFKEEEPESTSRIPESSESATPIGSTEAMNPDESRVSDLSSTGEAKPAAPKKLSAIELIRLLHGSDVQ